MFAFTTNIASFGRPMAYHPTVTTIDWASSLLKSRTPEWESVRKLCRRFSTLSSKASGREVRVLVDSVLGWPLVGRLSNFMVDRSAPLVKGKAKAQRLRYACIA